jgi:hypothetical protein
MSGIDTNEIRAWAGEHCYNGPATTQIAARYCLDLADEVDRLADALQAFAANARITRSSE